MDSGKRTETAAAMGDQGIKVYADIQVEGNGQLAGFREVDGRRLENVSRRGNFKQKLTLTTSRVPGTPSFKPGLHRVRLVVSSPGIAFTAHTVTYFVSGSASNERTAVLLKKPHDDAAISGKVAFKWCMLPGAGIYIITFREEMDAPPVFAAIAEKRVYTLREEILTGFFKYGQHYFWKVTAMYEEGDILGESEFRPFTINAKLKRKRLRRKDPSFEK